MSTAISTPEVMSWLDKLGDRNKALVALLRHLIIGAASQTHELVYHDALGHSTSSTSSSSSSSSSSSDRILYVTVSSNHINLGFFFGSSLDDPEHLLRGAGKRMRHIKITSDHDAQHPDVHKLIRKALVDGPEHVQRLHERRRTP